MESLKVSRAVAWEEEKLRGPKQMVVKVKEQFQELEILDQCSGKITKCS